MVQSSTLKKTDESRSNAKADSAVEEMVAQVYTLAREARRADVIAPPVTVDEAPRVFPNFTKIPRISGRCLLVSDAIALLAAFACGGIGAWAMGVYLFNSGFQQLFATLSIQQFAVFIGLGAVAILWLDTKGHYRQRLPYWEMVGHILAVAGLGLLAGGFIHFASKDPSSRLWVGLSFVLFAIFMFMGRVMVRRILNKHGQWQIPALVVGTGPTAEAALKAMKREPEMGFTMVGQVPSSMLEDLTKSHEWKHLLMTHGASHIFLALEGSEIEQNPQSTKAMVRARVPCSIIPPWLGLPSSTLSPHHFMMHDVLLLHDTNRLQLPLPRLMKRSFDVVVSGLALIAVAPLFAVVALFVRRDGGKAFFMQPRVGRHGKLFNCYKFRSMRSDAEAVLQQHLAESPEAAAEWKQYQKLKNDVRITKFGQFIRKTSVDELPQLINVFRGEMSLVGPRPIMVGQEDFYAEDFSFYEAVRPGITGPWQVSGRNKLTFKERVRLESWYARNWSFWMDIVIILKTIPALLSKDEAF